MTFTAFIPGMKPESTIRNILVGFVYLFFVYLIPFVLAYAVFTNRNGVADRLSGIPGISEGGGAVSAVAIFLVSFVVLAVIGAALPGEESPNTDASPNIDEDTEESSEDSTESDSSSDEQQEQGDDSEASDDDEDDSTATTDGSSSEGEAEAPSYQIDSEGDISYAGVVRLEFNVVTENHPDDLTDEELLALAEEVVNEATNEQAVNAIVIHIWDDPNGVGSTGNDAKVEWAPYGEWEDAGEVETGDYSEHEYVIDRPGM